VRQSPGRYVRRAKNDSLFAVAEGKVYFDQGGKRVNVMPTDPANECSPNCDTARPPADTVKMPSTMSSTWSTNRS